MANSTVVRSICIKVEKGADSSIWNEVESVLTGLGLNIYEHQITSKSFSPRKKVYLFRNGQELDLNEGIQLMQKLEEIFKIRFFSFDPASSKFNDPRLYPEPTMLVGIGIKEVK